MSRVKFDYILPAHSLSRRFLMLVWVCMLVVWTSPSMANLVLTAEERAYLEQHPIIKIANDPEWEPFEYIDENGKLAGMVADYVALFERKLGVKFEYLANQPWVQSNERVKTGELPVVMARHATEERKQYLNFTQPYVSFPVVVVAREDEEYIGTVEKLHGLVVAGVIGFNATAHLRKHHPEVPILEVFSIQEGLKAVITHRAYAFVANLGSVNYSIKKHGLDGLKVIGQLETKADLAIGVHKNEPILLSIMQKALADVSVEESQQIYDQWFHLRTVDELDRRQLWRLSLYGLSIFSVMLLFIVWLRYQQHKQQCYINQINEYSYATLVDLASMSFVWTSQSYARLVGCAPESLPGKSVIDLLGNGFSRERLALIADLIRSGQTWTGECNGVGCNHRSFWTLLTLTPQKNWRGQITHMLATRIDITDKKRIEQISVVDELTGLYNRRQFNLVLDQEIRRAKREQHTLFLATFDIDFFKLINDVYGHQQGDNALKQLANLSKKYFHRANDYVFRIGGEEFMLISSGDGVELFIAYLEEFRQAVFELAIPNQQAPLHYMTISIGACYWTQLDNLMADDLYHQVDQCVYQAKWQGRNQLVMCEP